MAQACGALYEDVVENFGFRHLDQLPLNRALSVAQRRRLADAWAWDKRNPPTTSAPWSR